MTDGTEKCNPKIEENQREDRRAFRKFIVLLWQPWLWAG